VDDLETTPGERDWALRCVLCGACVDDDDRVSDELFEVRGTDGRHLGLIRVCDVCLGAGRVPATVGRV